MGELLIDTERWVEKRPRQVGDWDCDSTPRTWHRCPEVVHSLSWIDRSSQRRIDLGFDPVPDLPAAVERFCIEKHLVHYVTQALREARRLFPKRKPSLRLEADPDGDESWIVIDVVSTVGVTATLGLEDEFESFLFDRVPLPARSMIRLAYSFT